MKKGILRNFRNTILLSGVGLIASLGLISCENFLNGAEIKNQIEEHINYANAESYKIRVDYPENCGIVKSPAGGETEKKVTDVFSVDFETASDWEFIRWKIVDFSTGNEISDDEYLSLSSLKDSKTECTFKKAPENGIQLCLEPVLAERPQIISYSPITSGVLKDSTIQVFFDKKMDPASIYYSKNEIDRLRKDGVADDDFLPKITEDELSGTLKNHYGYKKGGETFFKNISIKNKKTERSINDCFGAPVFINESTLSISVKAKDAVADYTQVLVNIEKGFFYVEEEKPVKMSDSKKWMYQVTDETDTMPLVIATNSDSSDKVSLKVDEDEISQETSHDIGSDGEGLDTLRFVSDDKKIMLNLEVEERNSTGSGPNDFFNLYVRKVLDSDYNPCAAAEQDMSVYYQRNLGISAKYDGEIDFDPKQISIDDGVYEMWFVFWDRSGNSTTYPDGKKYYFAKDETGFSSLLEPIVSGGEDNGKYTLGWNVPSETDYYGAVISCGIKGSESPSTETILKAVGSTTLDLDYSDTLYEISVAYIDYNGNLGDANSFCLRGNALTQEPVKLTGYEGTYSGGDYYKFGDFPQTISGISSYSSSPVCNGWYLGSDGYFYEKCTAKPFTGDDSYYTCTDGTTLVNGTTYYFKVEPIRWRKLTDSYDGKNLLFAENVLTANIPYSTYSSVRTIAGIYVTPNNYKYSAMRAYLNGKYEDADNQARTYSGNGFLQKAFTSSAQNRIALTFVDNSSATTTDGFINPCSEHACGNTNDKIFLLSMKDICSVSYGFEESCKTVDGKRMRKSTDYARANYAKNRIEVGDGGWYWLRSPFGLVNGVYTACDVHYNGDAYDKDNPTVLCGGIVPALCVSTLPEN